MLFISGLIIGSFVNALQYRIQVNKKNIGRSYCPKCKHQLVWYDIFPVLSWITLLGKCRYCQKRISIQYPLIEMITGGLFVSIGIKSGLVLKINDVLFGFINISNILITKYLFMLLLLLLITTILILLALHDAKTSYILSFYVYAGIVLSIGYHLIEYGGKWQIDKIFNYLLPFLISGIIPALLFLLLCVFSRGKWMGAGDAELALFTGIFLGLFLTPVAYYFAFIVGAVYGVSKIITKKSKMKSAIPFGPFLVTGCFFAYICGDYLITYYLRFMGL